VGKKEKFVSALLYGCVEVREEKGKRGGGGGRKKILLSLTISSSFTHRET